MSLSTGEGGGPPSMDFSFPSPERVLAASSAAFFAAATAASISMRLNCSDTVSFLAGSSGCCISGTSALSLDVFVVDPAARPRWSCSLASE